MQKRPLCACCLFLLLLLILLDSLGVPLIRGNPLPASLQEQLDTKAEVTVYGEAAGTSPTEYGTSLILKNAYLLNSDPGSSENISAFPPNAVPIGNLKVFFSEDITLKAGSLALLTGIIEPTPECRNPGEFDSRQYYAGDRIWYFLKKAKLLRATESCRPYRQFLIDLRQHLSTLLEELAGKDAPVFQAMLLGDRSGLEQETRLRFQFAGIVHILAISGLHISVIGLGLIALLERLGLGIAPASFTSLFFLLNYGLLTGQGTSTVRAILMCLFSIGARLSGRVYDLPTALSISGILLILEAPSRLYSASFLLSFGAVAGVGIVGNTFIKVWKDFRSSLHKETSPARTWLLSKSDALVSTLLASLGVQLATIPVMLYFYGETSITGLLLNLLVLPTAGLVLSSGILSLLLAMVLPFAAKLSILPGKACLSLYRWLCDVSMRFPFCTWIGGRPGKIQLIFYYLLLLASLFLIKERHGPGTVRQKWRHAGLTAFLLLIVSLFLLGYHNNTRLSVTFLDVGQGDGIVISTPEGKHFLIDGGSSSKKNLGQYQLIPFLKSQGISRLDGIFLSHTDEDHYSGVQELLDLKADGLSTIRISALYLPDWKERNQVWESLAESAGAAGAKVFPVTAGDTLSSGAFTLTAIAPLPGALGEDPNEDGMVLELSYKGFKALFTGDIGIDTENRLLPFLHDVDLLKVGHHGSKTSSGEPFLAQCRPELGVISCAEKNRYGHPSPEAVLRLQTAGCRLEYTMKSGAVTVLTDGRRLWIREFLTD